MPLTRLEPTGWVADHVFEAIHAAILSGELPAGTRLRIRDLAADLGTSVMPVRESIRRLEDIGLTVAEPYRGAVVKGFTATELLDLYATRRLLEVEASRLGAAALDPQGVDQLHEAYADMVRAIADRDVRAYIDGDEHFLTVLYAAAGNAVLQEMIQSLWQRCRSYKMRGAEQALRTEQDEDLLTHQAALLTAAAAQDEAMAARIAAESLDTALVRIRSSLPRTDLHLRPSATSASGAAGAVPTKLLAEPLV